MSVELPQESLEYILFPVDTSPVDPTTLIHQISMTGEFSHPTTWVTVPYVGNDVRVLVRASILAEPGGDVTLSVGRWRLWWRTDANPEEPVRQVGIISVV